MYGLVCRHLYNTSICYSIYRNRPETAGVGCIELKLAPHILLSPEYAKRKCRNAPYYCIEMYRTDYRRKTVHMSYYITHRTGI